MVIAVAEKRKTYGAPAEWARDIVQAASDLGYGVQVLEPGKVILAREREIITVESIFLTGPNLLRLLRERE